MRKILFLFAIISLAGLISCGDGEKKDEKNDKDNKVEVDPNYPKTPEEVVINFVTAWYLLDYEEAGKYYDGDFSQTKEIDEKLGKSSKDASFADVVGAIDGETATVTYIDTVNQMEGDIGLVMKDGVWKVGSYYIGMHYPEKKTVELPTDTIEIIEE